MRRGESVPTRSSVSTWSGYWSLSWTGGRGRSIGSDSTCLGPSSSPTGVLRVLVLGHHHCLLIRHLGSHHRLLLSIRVVPALVALLPHQPVSSDTMVGGGLTPYGIGGIPIIIGGIPYGYGCCCCCPYGSPALYGLIGSCPCCR